MSIYIPHIPCVLIVHCFSFVCCVYGAWKAKRKGPLGDLPGPPPESFLLGNFRQLMREQVGRFDVKLQNVYGMVARVKAPFGDDRLWVSDPKAIQYILQTSRYNFVKPYAARFALNSATGRGVNGAEGPDHYRQRRILLPAFGASAARAQLPVFRQCARELVQEFQKQAELLGDSFREENIPEFLGPAVLNALGLAAFNYDFRDDGEDRAEFAASLRDFMAKGFGLPSDWKVFCQGVMVHVPTWLLDPMIYFPSSGLAFLHRHVQLSNGIARRLIQSRLPESNDLDKKDALSRIVIANRSEVERWRLTDDELAPQLCTLLGAGYETTVTSLGWIFFELATHPDEQRRLRDEIYSVQAADDLDDTATVNFDELPFLNAVIKETVRFDTVVPHLFRVATRDEVIPLSEQVRCRSGSVTKELYIPQGTHIIISDVAYHRNRDIWGEDADVWRPSRWLDGSVKSPGTTVGVWTNLMSFGAGHRSCLGWRFALTEIQAFVFELISKLKFEAVEKTSLIRRENCLVMLPMVGGEERKGNQLPLGISIINHSG
ncbi:cytochrome P450 [Russula aff. rugulosa BPL654]|nr:cytochrome P450 [Russula aff. rugulosa BPL654]